VQGGLSQKVEIVSHQDLAFLTSADVITPAANAASIKSLIGISEIAHRADHEMPPYAAGVGIVASAEVFREKPV
jgi:hypothetical protein